MNFISNIQCAAKQLFLIIFSYEEHNILLSQVCVDALYHISLCKSIAQ